MESLFKNKNEPTFTVLSLKYIARLDPSDTGMECINIGRGIGK